MHSKLVLLGAMAAAAIFAAACGGTSTAGGLYGSASSAPSTQPLSSPVVSPSPKVAGGTTIAVGTTRLGQILVDDSGRTLYLFLADKGAHSACISSACVQYWPPVLTNGAPKAGAGISASLLGTTSRQDGTTEVTYAGHPLYHFISDKKAGDVSGQGVNGFGALWYVVSPSGMQVR